MNLYTASEQWATRPADERYESLAALRDGVHQRRLASRAQDVDLNRVEASLNSENQLVINSAVAPSEPSHWAFTQFAGLLKAPASYLRTLPKDLLIQNLNHGIHNAPRETVKFMTVAKDGTDTLQAVTSPTYGRIWDADVVDAVQRVVDRSGGKFSNPKAYVDGTEKPSGLYASDRDVFIFMVDGGSRLEAGPRAKLNRGFIVGNSEVGAKQFSLMTFLFNEVCGNHIIWGAQDVNTFLLRHSKGAPAKFDRDAYPKLVEYVESSAALEEQTIRRAQTYLLPAKTEDLDTLLSPFKFTRKEREEAVLAAKREEGDCRTLWNMVQGFTAYARDFEYVDARVDLEKRAGKLLNLVAN